MDQFHPLVLAAKFPHFPKFWFGDIIQLNITSDRHCSYGTVMGLDYQCTDLKVREKEFPNAQVGAQAYDVGVDQEFFWMYKVQAFSFHGWFTEQTLLKWGNKPSNLIVDYINKIDSQIDN